MEMHHFRYVIAVAETQNFSAAAKKLNLTQSGLSQQIQKLEHQLGLPLFHRSTRFVELTEAGRVFVQHAYTLLAQHEHVSQLMQQFTRLESGKLRIGVIPILGYLGLSGLLFGFHQAYPGIELVLREGGSHQIRQWLMKSEIDVGILTPPIQPETEKITYQTLFEDEIVLISPCSHPLAQRSRIALNEAEAESFIFMYPQFGMNELSIDLCRQAGFTPNIIYRSSQVETIFAFVGVGFGISLVTKRIADRALKDVCQVQITPKATRQTALAVQTGNQTPAVQAFSRFISSS